MADQIDPQALADRLPDVPLDPEDLADLDDELGWSICLDLVAVGGEERVAAIYAHDNPPLGDPDDQTGRALAIRLTEDGWVGDVEREDVTHGQWLDVVDAMGDALGRQVDIDSAVTTIDGDLQRLAFGDRPDD